MSTPQVPEAAGSASARPASSPSSSILKVVARLTLLAAGTVLLAMAVIVAVPAVAGAVRGIISHSFLSDTKHALVVVGVALGACLLLAAVTAVVCARRRWLSSWRAIGGTALGIAGVFGWLAWDEPTQRFPLTIDDGTAVDAATSVKSWELTLAFSPRDGKAPERRSTRPALSVPGIDVAKFGEWRSFLEKNQAEIRKTWEQLPERAWMTELNQYPMIGDHMPLVAEGTIMAFQPCRVLSQYTCAYASVLAMEGRGDDAIDTLVPLVEFTRKLEPRAHALIRMMIARVMLRTEIATARFILEQAPVSPSRKARLAAALRLGVEGAVLARRMVLVEQIITEDFFVRRLGETLAPSPGVWRSTVNAGLRLFLNPRATLNLTAEHSLALATHAERRELKEMAALQESFTARYARPHFKNMVGTLIVGIGGAHFPKVLESFWTTEDRRLALIADLTR